MRCDETDLLRAQPFALRTDQTFSHISHATATRPRLVHKGVRHLHRPCQRPSSRPHLHPVWPYTETARSLGQCIARRPSWRNRRQLHLQRADGRARAGFNCRPSDSGAHCMSLSPFLSGDHPLPRKCGIKKNDTSSSWTNFKYSIRYGQQCSQTWPRLLAMASVSSLPFWANNPPWPARKLSKQSLANTMTSMSLCTSRSSAHTSSTSQLQEFESLPSSHPSVPLLRDVIKELRDDELEHLDTAVEYHSQRAPAHALLSTIVGGGCKVAIELCKRF